MGQKERVAELEFQMRPKSIDHDRIYTALHQIEECTHPPAPDETQKQWEKDFIKKTGTRTDFIANGKMKEEQRYGL